MVFSEGSSVGTWEKRSIEVSLLMQTSSVAFP